MKSSWGQIRSEFPALEQKVNGQPLVYLDSAATALKPMPVIETLYNFYKFETANVHRGAHYLGDIATEKFEQTRSLVKDLISASSDQEIIFTSGTTDSINLIASTYGRNFLRAGDEIILTEMEHHSNIVPWQLLADEIGLKIKWVSVETSGELNLIEYEKLLNEKTKLVCVAHCSNVLGTVNPVKEIIKMAHAVNAKVLVDAAQSVTFLPINVRDLDCDFLVFSGHKLYGPYGIGVLFGKHELLEIMPPYRGGGAMIAHVTKDKTTFLGAPQRFEAGTPNISGVIGLGAAISYIKNVEHENIYNHSKELLQYSVNKFSELDFIKIVGQSSTRVNILSLDCIGMHPSDVGQILNQQGVATRTGHHCAQVLMSKLGITGTLRVSFAIYNSAEDIDILVSALIKAKEILT
ncbi:MAG: cysteine sulfinate desulfinase [Bdellovibrionales bacterium RBG_16_40_8]|nr:MAG: cysteine sulfinate desulfinase [Bdellovibrionales bacterium RBG_16_40_8]